MDEIQRLNTAALQNVHTIKKALLKKIIIFIRLGIFTLIVLEVTLTD